MPLPTLRPRLAENPAAWAALCGLVLAARYPDWIRRPRLWAEDGNVFFLHASRNWLADVFTPYAGYYHLLPRTIAWVGAKLDPALIPAFYVYSALAVTLLVVARVFSGRLHLPCKPLLALAIVSVPGTGEVFLTPTNLQWITALALVLTLLMADPGTPLDRAADLLVVLVAGLTGPFSIFAAPFYLHRALSRRTAASAALACAVLVAGAAQAWQVVFHPAPSNHPHGPFDAPDLVAVLSGHIPLAFVDAQAWVYRTARAVVIGLGAVGFALIASALLVRDEFRRERVQLVLFGAAFVGLTTMKIRFDLWDYREMLNADRYFFIPKVIVLWLAVSCLHGRPPAARAFASLAGAALLAVAWFTPYLEGPLYALRHEERAYYAWGPFVDTLRQGGLERIQWSPGWTCVVPERPGPMGQR